jgi:hypothetical protein
MPNIDRVLKAQRILYRKKLEEIIPQHRRTIEVYLTMMEFFMEKNTFSMTELRNRFVEVDGKSMSVKGFTKHIHILLNNRLLSRPHYRAVEFVEL